MHEKMKSLEGNTRKQWTIMHRHGKKKTHARFFEQFGEIYGHKSGTRPTYTLSSRVLENDKTVAKNQTDEYAETEDTEDS